jgi:hypothetical protein
MHNERNVHKPPLFSIWTLRRSSKIARAEKRTIGNCRKINTGGNTIQSNTNYTRDIAANVLKRMWQMQAA